jgi:hypothetical protein
MATRGGGCATQRHSLSTCHLNGAPVAVKEDTAAVTKLLFVRLISKDLMMMILLLFLQKQNLAFAVYQFGSVLSLPD